MSKLKPCPFCGSTDIKFDPDEICCPIQYSVQGQCNDCGAQEPSGSGVYDSKKDAINDAIEAWNTRANEQEVK